MKGGTIINIDNENDYYDVSLKEYRLAEIAEIAEKVKAEGISYSFVKGDIADKALIDKLFAENKFDVVVNLAAQAGVRYSITNPDAYIMSNMMGFYNILEACRHYPEGEMTKARAYSVCETSLSEFANQFSFSDFLKVGKCEAKVDGKYRASILGDAVEATIGAIYLDSGYEKARSYIEGHIAKQVEVCIKNGNKDYKTQLQEKLQVNGDVKIEYRICGTKGPEHDKCFIAEVYCDGKFMGRGEGKNKKEAEMEAAREALK